MIDILLTSNRDIKTLGREENKFIDDLLKCYGEISISLFPNHLEDAGVLFMDKNNISLGAVSLFAPYTYPEVTALEIAMTIENGADFIEMPIDVSLYMEDASPILSFIRLIAEEIGDDAKFWIVLDSERFEDFNDYSKALEDIINAGASGIVINNYPKKIEEIKYLSESLDFVLKLSNELKIKAFVDKTNNDYSFTNLIKRVSVE